LPDNHCTATGNKPPRELEPRLSLEFHRWGSTPEGVTGGRTIYEHTFSDLRRDAARLHSLCDEITGRLQRPLPERAETLLLAGRLYRRSADYARACEYFLETLKLIRSSAPPGSDPCA